MIREISANDFSKDEKIYVFEMGFAIFIKDLGYNDEENEYIYSVLLEEDTCESRVHSSMCFTIVQSKMVRTWFLDTIKVDLHYTTTNSRIRLIYSGEPVVVSYDKKRDFETFKEGDRLHNDWEGNGIEFDVLIEKWLRRLNGEIIPLSDYYRDPHNRFLDSRSDSDT